MPKGPNKDKWRLVCDYRLLNAQIVPQHYTLPAVTDIIDSIVGKKVFTICDFQSGFWQVPVHEDDIYKTAFACFCGTYAFRRCPQGISNSPSAYQAIMESLRRKCRANLWIYVDDIVIASETIDEHLRDIDEVLGMIAEFGMKLRIDKTVFCSPKIKFLGFIISEKGIEVNPDKMKAIREYPRPETATACKSFLGMTSYFRRFIPNYARIAQPMYNASSKPGKIVWNESLEKSFEMLKEKLMTPPVLAPPRLNEQFFLETDGSLVGIAACLTQLDKDGNPRPIGFESRLLTKYEKNYVAIELEALAIVYGVQKFKAYIANASTTIITDHAPLTTLFTKKGSDRKIKQISDNSTRRESRICISTRKEEFSM